MENKTIGAVRLETECGALRGNEREDCFEFLGVPFAHAARFAYAAPVERWEGELDATRFGPACPQNRAWHEHLEHPSRRFYWKEYREGSVFTYDEDCLNVNIYTPKRAENCPVVLFFHGGGFDSGINCESPFDGAALAARGIVSVFANYRVGVLGYLTHEELKAQYGREGNFGLDDQLTALRWVRAHIGDFGGDAENLTLLGQSAGAIAVQFLCLNHEHRGLFRRAVMLSGAGLFPRFALPRRAADTREYWHDFMRTAHCKNLAELKAASLDTLFDTVEALQARRKDNTYNTMPVVDGALIPGPIDKLISDPLPLDYLVGFTNNDMYAPVMAWIGERFAKKHGGYACFFDLDAPGGDGNAAFHSSDLRYVFGTLDGSWRPYGERDYEASRQMTDYLANFARTGDPNGPGLPVWKQAKHGVLRIAKRRTAMGRVHYPRLVWNALTKGEPKAK